MHMVPRRDSNSCITEGNYHRAWPIGYCNLHVLSVGRGRSYAHIACARSTFEVSEVIVPSDSDGSTSTAFLEHLIIEDFS